MNILLITVRGDFGGGPRHVDQIVEYLDHHSYDIFIACPIENPYGDKWFLNKRIKGFFEIPHRKFSFKKLFSLKSFVKRNKIDVIHSHGNGGGFYSRLLKLFFHDIKIVHTFHGLTDNYSSKLKKILNLCLNRFFRFLTDRFIFVSNGEYELAKRLKAVKDRDNEFVIYNGINKNDFKRKYENNAIFKIVSLSRFDFQKNMDFAYHIALNFRNNDYIKFVWVGNGEDFFYLKEKSIKNRCNISFEGFSTEPIKFLENSDIYLSTSRFEGLPYALIEAASVGLPIVATNVLGNNEVVKHGYNGFLFDTEEEAVAGIEELYYNRTKLEQMSKNSLRLFNESFTIESMINGLKKVYESCK